MCVCVFLSNLSKIHSRGPHSAAGKTKEKRRGRRGELRSGGGVLCFESRLELETSSRREEGRERTWPWLAGSKRGRGEETRPHPPGGAGSGMGWLPGCRLVSRSRSIISLWVCTRGQRKTCDVFALAVTGCQHDGSTTILRTYDFLGVELTNLCLGRGGELVTSVWQPQLLTAASGAGGCIA